MDKQLVIKSMKHILEISSGDSSIWSFLGSLGILCSLNSLTFVIFVNSLLSELLVHLEFCHILGDSHSLDWVVDCWKSKNWWGNVLFDVLELVSSRVVDQTLLDNVASFFVWEKNKFRLVIIQPLDVSSLSFSILVMSSVINSNSDGLREGHGQTSVFQLSNGETSANLNLCIVSFCLTHDNWSKLTNRSWETGSSFGCSLILSDFLMSHFVEEASNSNVMPLIPMLPHVGAR